jgi:predicted Zn-dependent protease with MMP-like domain
MTSRLSLEEFEKLVARALDEIPEELATRMSNVEIVIDDARVTNPSDPRWGLLGLYEGIPLTERDSAYGWVMPDRITLFKHNLEDEGRTADGICETVRRTLIHEVAHHFGIDDDRLTELGWD